jgi:urease accessory protein
MDSPALAMLRILQLADSALPIGSLSHSFGLEALIFDRDVEDSRQECAASLSQYLEGCLAESTLIDAVLCREAHGRSLQSFPIDDLNRQASALRMARESREASMSMGRRLAALAAALHPSPALAALARLRELHHSVAFGYTLGILGADADATVSAFLHQFLLNMVSAAQRLEPLGQVQASQIVWDLKLAILETVKRSAQLSAETVCAFNHLPEVASMRHACLSTRLFIS